MTRPPGLICFWLAVLVRTVNGNDVYAAIASVTALAWFLWNYTASCVPRQLLPKLVQAAAEHADEVAIAHAHSKAMHCVGCNMAIALLWLLATDDASATLVTRPPQLSDAGLRHVQAMLLNQVRPHLWVGCCNSGTITLDNTRCMNCCHAHNWTSPLASMLLSLVRRLCCCSLASAACKD